MSQVENVSSEQLVETIVKGIQEKKGTNIVILDMRQLGYSICQYFIICDGTSNTHVDAVANEVIDYTRINAKEKPYRSEGFENAQWILIDYVDVIVHVFQRDIREFYALEKLWADAKQTVIENL